MLAIIIFILTILLCLSTYALYPLAIWFVSKINPLKVCSKDITPHVSIIIPAYNEEKTIKRKIENTLALDYTPDRIEILVGSDGSSDKTASIAASFFDKGVQLVDFKTNRGKTAVQNDLAVRSKGEILIFTDAASFLKPDAIKKIVRKFSDDRIGCVAGQMQFIDTDTNITTESQGLYWRYEFNIRKIESSLGRLIGVDGPLYAVRKENYIPLEHHMISDLMTPLLVLEFGKRVTLEPDAVVTEVPTVHAGQEFNTRRRITLRGIVGLFTHRRLLNPLKNPILAIQIFFHKVLRWFVGPLVIINFISCLTLSEHLFFRLFIILYVFFIIAAFLGWLIDKFGKKITVFTIPYYFSLVNFAATTGILDFIRKKQANTWKPVRH